APPGGAASLGGVSADGAGGAVRQRGLGPAGHAGGHGVHGQEQDSAAAPGGDPAPGPLRRGDLMTGCPSTDVLEQLLADEVSGAPLASLQTHVQGCPACQEALERLTAAPPRQGAISLRGEEAFLIDLIRTPPAQTIMPPTGRPGLRKRPEQAAPPRIAGYEL